MGGYLPIAQVINDLRQPRTRNYYVLGRFGAKAYVEIFEVTGRPPCLRTRADRTWTENLLSLPSRRAA